MDKPKIFVRYAPGCSGHFISLLILALVKDITLINPLSGHQNDNDINFSHTFGNQWTEEFNEHTKSEICLETSTNWIKNNFQFFPTADDIYVVHTHVINPDPLMMAFTNTKLVNITFADQDKDQMAFNWVTKSMYVHNQFDIVNKKLKLMKNHYGKLIDVPDNSINQYTDKRLITYIVRHMIKYFHAQFKQQQIGNYYKVFNIEFSSIANKQIIHQIDDIIEFLGLTVTTARKENAIKLITEYSTAQIAVPWNLDINDYT